ncbi:uncharacterized protein [Nicotiana tomentosiformis]|uniref:uncharacterized protein n=1 Tax=Nicotiana tomentosiformis TaxID=4098 RepID=UPI00388C84AC
MSEFPRLEWKGSLGCTSSKVISFLKAQRKVGKGCLAYLAFFCDVMNDTHTVESVQVVRGFLDMFPTYLSGMPPNRNIDFSIDLAPGMHPIFIPQYRMAPAVLKELKEQLQDLLDKGFSRTIVSP